MDPVASWVVRSARYMDAAFDPRREPTPMVALSLQPLREIGGNKEVTRSPDSPHLKQTLADQVEKIGSGSLQDDAVACAV